MHRRDGLRTTGMIVMAVLSVTTDIVAQERRSPERERAAIERLHQQDVEATLSDKADLLAQLWDRDAVRLSSSGPAEVGQATIYADDKRWEATNTGRTLSYHPDVKDVQIVGDWAFEWGYFDVSFKESANAVPGSLHGKQLRILKRQADGSWKFARVMSLIDSRKE
jgi:ketosteroid isomerase-like protein